MHVTLSGLDAQIDITLSLQIHLSGTLFRLGLDDAEDARYGHMLLNNSMDKYE